jgi:hypothetical protein
MPEPLLRHLNLIDLKFLSLLFRELCDDGKGGLFQLLQQSWRYSQTVATGELDDLADVAEAGAHYDGVVVVLAEVVVDGGDGFYAGVVAAGEVGSRGVFFMPVEDSADEGAD